MRCSGGGGGGRGGEGGIIEGAGGTPGYQAAYNNDRGG